MSPPSTTAGRCSLALTLLLVLPAVVGAPAVAATEAAGHDAGAPEVDRGNLTALLPPPGADDLDAVEAAAANGELRRTDAIHYEGIAVFRLNTSVAENGTAPTIGDGLEFRLLQLDRTTTPSRAPRALDAPDSGDAVRTFVANGSPYVAVDLRNASWVIDYDTEREMERKPPYPGEAYTANATITVGNETVTRTTEIAISEPEITNEPTTDDRGVVELRVSMPGTRTATVAVANESRGYRDAIGVYDHDGDGNVTLRFDTTLAGNPEGAPAPFSASGADATVVPDTVAPRFDGALPAGSYRIGVSRGDTAGVPRFSPTLTVTERPVGELDPMAAPAGATLTDDEAVGASLGADSLTATGRVAATDTLVLRLNASGVDGLSADGPLLGDELRTDLVLASQSSHREPAALAPNASAGAVDAVATPEAVYVAVDLRNATFRRPGGATTTATAGSTVGVEATLTGDATAGANATRNASAAVVEPRLALDVPARAPANGNVTATVTSSLAPGSAVTVGVDGHTTRAVLDDDGVARASIAPIVDAGETVTVRASAVAAPTVNDTERLTVDPPATTTPAGTAGDPSTADPTNASGVGFGVLPAAVALLVAFARRR